MGNGVVRSPRDIPTTFSYLTIRNSPVLVRSFEGRTIEDGVAVVFQEDPGLTPRLCEGLFARIEEERKNERNYGVSVR